MEFKDIEGKTILRATQVKLTEFDDEGWLRLEFTDGTACLVVGGYAGYTGKSLSEYPTQIDILEDNTAYVPVET